MQWDCKHLPSVSMDDGDVTVVTSNYSGQDEMEATTNGLKQLFVKSQDDENDNSGNWTIICIFVIVGGLV